MFETFDDVFNRRSKSYISHKHVLHEVDKVNVIVNFLKLVWSEESFAWPCNPKVKLEIVWTVEQVISC
jgi:hypothetical protein